MPRIHPFAQLLRTIAAPRTVACQHQLRFSTATPKYTEKSKSHQTPPPPSKNPPPPSRPNTTSTHPSTTQKQTQRAADLATAEALTESDSAQAPSPTPTSPPKWHVSRSKSKNLPVYTDSKRGGNLRLTTVRRITGDIRALKEELGKALDSDEVGINALTQHVIVKGHHKEKIEQFLTERGM
ncbi:hypothetical protein IAQ61_010490 [Plenodomus lingam]|uniref:Large ribosomal subunit protein mL49 n=1 Tax=Leptosphaeria maculans (strain JN3 / isolate v23.1.3 / race Av1-4-5-6-7-8) TaxID=985895 RepID=E5A448_LEPMJ|nr:hypothetical protein LEMA_P098020.1 [Plenodomus lingam JN3]KAH9862287.1 hypothetical protein IAQ61_010490 [Plenodomus lingam]CBX98393.1 hypothetical protein LEMA_P098020.1 [Plenodomus lingam JN3]